MNTQDKQSNRLYTGEQLRGFQIEATDGKIGSIYDLIFAPADWIIRYLAVDTGAWLPGKKVIIPVASVTRIDSANKSVVVSITRDQVKDSPGLEALDKLDREFEERLFAHFQRPGYWIRESRVDEASWESFPASDPPAKW